MVGRVVFNNSKCDGGKPGVNGAIKENTYNLEGRNSNDMDTKICI